MKDDHKNMLLGFLAAKSRKSSHKDSFSDKYLSHLNWFQQGWLIVLFILLIFLILLFLYFSMDVLGGGDLESVSKDELTEFWILFILGIGALPLIYKALQKFPRAIFWLTFGPFFLFCLFGILFYNTNFFEILLLSLGLI